MSLNLGSEAAVEARALNDGWKSVAAGHPPECKNVLLAFDDHWNAVVGFWSCTGWWETSAHDVNSKIEGMPPTWWHDIPDVPHRLLR
jgi:hypothetical protein